MNATTNTTEEFLLRSAWEVAEHVGGDGGFRVTTRARSYGSQCGIATFDVAEKIPDRRVAAAIAQTPDVLLVLEALCVGVATIDPATREFVFDGMRYGNSVDRGYINLVDAVGRDRLRAAVLAKGGAA